ncbi:hypothetical protein ACD591_13235 [Rufibacter glacialis]|uniref:PorT family protein n=1 Tax=Rufibacter glacialis TaxID=1259555 RepID=A0A5M8Q8N0_9BACT|nr:hypothetical protein [Rufibacter glacialis]KAA6431180.1 hypothetical protein FOE74_18995 [Rufibacter glacialis]GGK84732.1 hypothetical protein GCM10011405_35780 [Rufibacter glacialis]
MLGGGNATLRGQIKYIAIPVLARITVDSLFFEFANTVSFLLKSYGKMEHVSVSIKEYTNKVDFSYAASLRYQFTEGLGLGLRYNGGISKIYKEGSENFEAGKVHNSVFQLSLSFMLGGR